MAFPRPWRGHGPFPESHGRHSRRRPQTARQCVKWSFFLLRNGPRIAGPFPLRPPRSVHFYTARVPQHTRSQELGQRVHLRGSVAAHFPRLDNLGGSKLGTEGQAQYGRRVAPAKNVVRSLPSVMSRVSQCPSPATQPRWSAGRRVLGPRTMQSGLTSSDTRNSSNRLLSLSWMRECTDTNGIQGHRRD